jgi:hypothetical protein
MILMINGGVLAQWYVEEKMGINQASSRALTPLLALLSRRQAYMRADINNAGHDL